MQKRNFNEAVEDFKKWVQIKPYSINGWTNLYVAFIDAGRSPDAINGENNTIKYVRMEKSP